MQRLGVAGDDGAAEAHGLEQAPVEHDGIGEVDVDAGALQQGDEVRIAQLAEEVHPRPVGLGDLGAHFVGKDLAPGCVAVTGWIRWAAVPSLIAANDQHSRLRPALEQGRKDSHKPMVAAVWLKIAVGKSNDLICAPDGDLVAGRGFDRELHRRVTIPRQSRGL